MKSGYETHDNVCFRLGIYANFGGVLAAGISANKFSTNTVNIIENVRPNVLVGSNNSQSGPKFYGPGRSVFADAFLDRAMKYWIPFSMSQF